MTAAAQLPAQVAAQSNLAPFHLRTAAASAFMLSKDQRSWLEYDQPGLLLDLQLAYSALPWLDLQVGATGGVFFSHEPGGLAAPVVGVLGRVNGSHASPYALIDLGIGFTGQLLRPFARLGAGVDFDISRSLRLGPTLGLGLVTQWNSPGYSSSALYAWLGLAVSYGSGTSPQPAAAEVERRAEARQEPEPPPLEAAEPIQQQHSPGPPSQALEALLDRALPSQKLELLAPVLFDFDSDAPNANGIAMLHEVARVLTLERSDIELLEIGAYSDARGSEQHNLELARRRAERVRSWLIENGVAEERLQINPLGAVDFVETGAQEENHLQNRRVVFRILRVRQP
jgi:outer membrane protein OmpA-like peptidoglycan-associated protein